MTEEIGRESIAEAENNLKATIQSLKETKSPEKPAEAEPEKDAEKSPGAEFVEVADPAVKQRLDFLYGRWRYAEERNNALISHQKELEGALTSSLEKLDTVIKKQNQKDESDALSLLRQQKQQARDRGDEQALDRADEQIAQFIAEQKLRAVQPPAPKPQPVQPPQSQLNPNDVNYIEWIKSERDSVGNIRRPWLHNWHPDFNKAVERAADITNTLQSQGKPHSLEAVMREVDRYMMGASQSNGRAEVLGGGGNLTTPLGNKKIGLTEQDRQIARKLGFKRDELDAYAKRKAKIDYTRAISIEDFD